MSLVRMPNRGSTSITLTRARGRPCEMERLFSPESRCTIWRKLWLWLAESQKELGIVYLVPNPGTNNFREERIIEDEALEQLRRCCHVFHYQATKPVEHLLDIRAQYHFVTDLDAPRSKHWLNIGVTHEYTLENTEQILMACALDILNTKFSMLLYRLRNFAMDHRSAQCLMYKPDSETPYLTTIGEKVAGWAKTLGSILWAFQILRCNIGSAGSQPITPGEQNSIAFFDKLSMTQHFEGDRSKCEKLDDLLRQKMGFERCHAKDYFGYRSDTNGHLGHLCDKLGDTALQVVEDLDHFDSTGQLVEKRATNNGSPVTAGDPLYRQSPLLRIASETLRQVAHTFKDPRVSKTSGHEEYIMARLFKHAARVVRVLQSIVEGLYYDAQNAYNIKCFMMPLMISSPLISRITPRGEDRMTVMWHLGVIGMLVMYQPFQLRTHGFLYMLRRHEFFRRHADEVRNAILSVGDVSHSQTLVYEICGENGIIDRRLQPYSGYIREMTAGEARLQAPLRIQAALGH